MLKHFDSPFVGESKLTLVVFLIPFFLLLNACLIVILMKENLLSIYSKSVHQGFGMLDEYRVQFCSCLGGKY